MARNANIPVKSVHGHVLFYVSFFKAVELLKEKDAAGAQALSGRNALDTRQRKTNAGASDERSHERRAPKPLLNNPLSDGS
jgi:hypothetical protein